MFRRFFFYSPFSFLWPFFLLFLVSFLSFSLFWFLSCFIYFSLCVFLFVPFFSLCICFFPSLFVHFFIYFFRDHSWGLSFLFTFYFLPSFSCHIFFFNFAFLCCAYSQQSWRREGIRQRWRRPGHTGIPAGTGEAASEAHRQVHQAGMSVPQQAVHNGGADLRRYGGLQPKQAKWKRS
jgi:hypothetical protein